MGECFNGGNYSFGKDELLRGSPYMYHLPYAGVLTSREIAVLAIDHWNFGDAEDAWKLIRYGVGHVETAAMRGNVLEFLDSGDVTA